MQIKIVTVDFQISSRAKNAIRWVLMPLALFVGSIAVSHADPLDTSWIQPGHAIPASSMSAAFVNLDARIVTLETKPIVNGRKYSLGATYVGRTDFTSKGDLGGYSGAKIQCKAKFGDTAHMCTSEELVRTAQLGIATLTGWYSTGVWAQPNGAGGLSDCLGWQSDVTSDIGPLWYGNDYPNAPVSTSFQLCNNEQYIVCCD